MDVISLQVYLNIIFNLLSITVSFIVVFFFNYFRYVPVGILENPPQKMNDRPPYYRGRDEIETLMASSNCADWIKIS